MSLNYPIKYTFHSRRMDILLQKNGHATPLQEDGHSTLGRWALDLENTETPFSTAPCAGYRTSWENRFSYSSPLLGIHVVEANGSSPYHSALSHKQRGMPEVKAENNGALTSLTQIISNMETS